MLSYVSYLQIYASVFSCILLTLFPGALSYRNFVIIMSFIGALVLLIELCRLRKGVNKVALVATIGASILILYMLTGFFYADINFRYNTFFLVLLGQVLPAIICASIVAHNEVAQHKIMKLSLPFGILFGIIAFISAFFPDSETSGGYVSNESGLNYQSTSYLAAYSAGFCLYYLFCYKDMDWKFIILPKWLNGIMKMMVFVNFITILIAGGRGALVLFILELLTFIYLLYKTKRISMKNAISVIVYFVLSLCFIVGGVIWAANSHIKTSGFQRIIMTITEGHQSGRELFREIAVEKFFESPAYGHGVGSVFNEVGMYTHNFIFDSIVEAGIIGALLYMFFIFCSFRKGWQLIKGDNSNFLWLIIFLHGLGMSLFSGYYLAQLPLFWAGTFMLCKKSK